MLGLPVEALRDREGRQLGDRFAVTYVPSATVHAWLAEQDRPMSSGPRATLLVGDPPFQGRWPRLPGTREEVMTLASLCEDPTILLGPRASERELVALSSSRTLGRFRVIHLATHALVDEERPERSALVLSQIDLPDPVEAALSGGRIYDGLLTAGEIVREWNLDADLVTLSACRTALGRPVGGEGYIGLAQAFLQAGARSLLVSLWKVDDRATSLLMRRFYESLWGLAGERSGELEERVVSRAEALREAKSWLRGYRDEQGRRPYRHPFYWSPFVLLGAAG